MVTIEKDPATLRRVGTVLAGAIVCWPLLSLSDFHPARFFDAGNMTVMAGFLGGFLPPTVDPDFLRLLWTATLQTLAIATAGMALSLAIAFPLALLTATPLIASMIGPGPGRFRAMALRRACRLLLLWLRSIPEVVWALLFVRVLGLGPAAGVLALGVTYGGLLGKVYVEVLESADARHARSLMEAGSGRLAAFMFGLFPDVAPELVSYTVYRWECAVRASVVMGFVGAGGLGQLLDQSLKMLTGGEVSTILIVFLGLVVLADLASAALRRSLQ